MPASHQRSAAEATAPESRLPLTRFCLQAEARKGQSRQLGASEGAAALVATRLGAGTGTASGRPTSDANAGGDPNAGATKSAAYALPKTAEQYRGAINSEQYTDEDAASRVTQTEITDQTGAQHKVACGDGANELPCLDGSDEGVPKRGVPTDKRFPTKGTGLSNDGHISPGGNPSQIMPSWGKNPSETLDATSYGKPHSGFFKAEPGKACVPSHFCSK
jgi:hypothetical protein